MNIPTHKNKTSFQFIDVFETLALLYVVNLEIKKYLEKQVKTAKEEDTEKMREEIQLNLKNLEENEDLLLAKSVAKKKIKIRQSKKVYNKDEDSDNNLYFPSQTNLNGIVD